MKTVLKLSGHPSYLKGTEHIADQCLIPNLKLSPVSPGKLINFNLIAII